MRRALLVLSLLAVAATPIAAAGLQARIVATPRIGDALIVGRATCGATVSLLTETPELVELSIPGGRASVRPVAGLRRDDQPWGLACVRGGALWTLATPHALVRLSREGRVVERINVQLPRIALFASGDRLVFQQLPLIVAGPVLASSPARQPSAVTPWIGSNARAAASRSDQLAQNLVNCGIGVEPFMPCWFADEARITVSDGVSAHTIPVRAVQTAGVDASAPIRDVALAGADWLWVLATAATPSAGRRAGGRLLKIDRLGAARDRLDLSPPARLILGATASACWLLTVHGEVMEVSER